MLTGCCCLSVHTVGATSPNPHLKPDLQVVGHTTRLFRAPADSTDVVADALPGASHRSAAGEHQEGRVRRRQRDASHRQEVSVAVSAGCTYIILLVPNHFEWFYVIVAQLLYVVCVI